MDVENVIVNGVELSQPAKLCEVFRSYFRSTFRNDEGNDPQLNYSAIIRMQHFTISAEDVHRQLINLNPKKSEGADEIHPKILTSLARYLAAPLAKIFNNSLEALFLAGIIPVEWKSSILCPIYNKGSKNNVANYRPICLTSVACKILERILKENILQYLKKLPF